ncbi:MAG: peptidase [Gemmatimonadetes bacterium]|nr:peptidase [Gemmatimonadota bacterium]
MPRTRLAILPLALALCAAPAAAHAQAMPADTSVGARYREDAARLIRAATTDTTAWSRLATLTDTFGHRLSGSRSLEQAIDWILAEMRRDGLDAVRGEPVMVPHWVRGAESAVLLTPREAPLAMIGLGSSVGTPPEGVTADVLVVNDFDELRRRAGEARGKIVLIDEPFTTYRQTVRYRGGAATAAARVGAVAALIRSVSSYSIRNPHTGNMRYDTTGGVPRIPTAALSVEDAMMLHRMQDRGERVRLRLTMGAQTLPDAPSRNVVAEIRGRERPDEVVIVSGHIDSWDVGQGAMDDAGGAVAAWEAVRLMKALGLHPRRTVRVVMWTNEENGVRGGSGYRDAHRAELGKHVLAIESDNGVFKPSGFRYDGPARLMEAARRVGVLLEPVGAGEVNPGETETDTGPIGELGVPTMGLEVDGTKYFWFHHSAGDTMDKLDPREMAQCVAAMAVMAYVIADLPDDLTHPVAAAPAR